MRRPVNINLRIIGWNRPIFGPPVDEELKTLISLVCSKFSISLRPYMLLMYKDSVFISMCCLYYTNIYFSPMLFGLVNVTMFSYFRISLTEIHALHYKIVNLENHFIASITTSRKGILNLVKLFSKVWLQNIVNLQNTIMWSLWEFCC